MNQIVPYRGLTVAEAKQSLPQGWQQYIRPVSYLYCLTHAETGERITRYGTTWEVIDPNCNAIVADWDLPLCLIDQTIDPTVWIIGAAYSAQT